MMFQPFIMQHPLMMQHHPQQQQVHSSPWGNAGMMQQQQQQGGAWYGGMQMGRGGMQMGMATPYSFTPAGFFPVRASGVWAVAGWVGGWALLDGTTTRAACAPSALWAYQEQVVES
jgi:hypothetical protein